MALEGYGKILTRIKSLVKIARNCSTYGDDVVPSKIWQDISAITKGFPETFGQWDTKGKDVSTNLVKFIEGHGSHIHGFLTILAKMSMLLVDDGYDNIDLEHAATTVGAFSRPSYRFVVDTSKIKDVLMRVVKLTETTFSPMTLRSPFSKYPMRPHMPLSEVMSPYNSIWWHTLQPIMRDEAASRSFLFYTVTSTAADNHDYFLGTSGNYPINVVAADGTPGYTPAFLTRAGVTSFYSNTGVNVERVYDCVRGIDYGEYDAIVTTEVLQSTDHLGVLRATNGAYVIGFYQGVTYTTLYTGGVGRSVSRVRLTSDVLRLAFAPGIGNTLLARVTVREVIPRYIKALPIITLVNAPIAGSELALISLRKIVGPLFRKILHYILWKNLGGFVKELWDPSGGGELTQSILPFENPGDVTLSAVFNSSFWFMNMATVTRDTLAITYMKFWKILSTLEFLMLNDVVYDLSIKNRMSVLYA